MPTKTNDPKRRIRIALMPARGLGDSLLFLILANNLQRCGYEISFYSSMIYELRNWVPNIFVSKFINNTEHSIADINNEMSRYDLIIADTGSVLRYQCVGLSKELFQRIVFINMENQIERNLIFQYGPDNFLTVTQQAIKNELCKIANAAGGCSIGALPGHPLVNKMTFFCGDVLGIKDSSCDSGMVVPPGLSYRKHPKRVTIHPTSSSPRRNWPSDKYIALARRLKSLDWELVICVAPNEWGEWNDKLNSEFELPEFSDLNALAGFMYESGYMIGNDSGPGHLASCLKIPALIVWKKFNDRRWQPGWFFTELVSSPFKIPFVHTYYWYYLVSVKKVIKQFQFLVTKHAKYFSSRTATS